jgi:hypothetical protein
VAVLKYEIYKHKETQQKEHRTTNNNKHYNNTEKYSNIEDFTMTQKNKTT